MSIEFDRRVQVNKIIESQLPEFVVADFPLATDFLKQYYISQEYQGGATDLIDNLDRYLKVDNLVPDPIVGTSTLDAIKLFMEDDETKGIVMIGEIGIHKIGKLMQ